MPDPDPKNSALRQQTVDRMCDLVEEILGTEPTDVKSYISVLQGILTYVCGMIANMPSAREQTRLMVLCTLGSNFEQDTLDEAVQNGMLEPERPTQ